MTYEATAPKESPSHTTEPVPRLPAHHCAASHHQFDELVSSGCLVQRPSVVERLASAVGIVAVLAPAGYGKTTLVCEWESLDGRPFLWVELAHEDDSAELIVEKIITVMSGREPDRGPLARSTHEQLRDLVEQTTDPTVLVFDGLEHVHSREGLKVLEHVGIASGSALVCVYVGRGMDGGVLVRLRSARSLIEVGLEELIVAPDAAGAVAGRRITAEAAAELHARTEGWPMGLRLAGLAAEADATDPAVLSGRDRLISDYVRTEVLSGLEPAVLALMTRCSVFDVVNAELCDAVLERSDSQRSLEYLDQAQMFLLPLDRERRQYRWHRLVREALIGELERFEPDLVIDLRERGAKWFAANGRPQQAVEQLLAVGDRASSVTLLEDILLPMFHSGQMSRLVEWIHEIGDDRGDQSGFLATTLAYSGMMTGDSICAHRWARVADEFYPSRDEDSAGLPAFLVMRAHLCPDGLQAMLDDTAAAMRLVPESSPWRAPTLVIHGTALLLNDRGTLADDVLEEAAHVAVEARAYPAAVLALSEGSLSAASLGKASLATRRAQQAISVLDEAGLAEYPLVALAFAACAAVDAREGNLDRARANYVRADLLRPMIGRALPWLGVQMRLQLARTATILGEHGAAEILMRETTALVGTLPDPGRLLSDVESARNAHAGVIAGSRPNRPLLTAAEMRLLPLLPSHLSFEDIGERLYVSKNTVKTHAMSIYRKLGVSSRAEAVVQGRRIGVIDPGND